jgi:hypothetical protein
LMASVGPLLVPGAVEVGQDVSGSGLEGPAEFGDLDQRGGDAGADGFDELDHQLTSCRAVFVPVGGDHSLVDAPGRLDLHVLVWREQGGEPLGLCVGEQVSAGVQGPPGPVERVALAAAVAVQVLLDAAPAGVQGVPGQAHDVKGIHDRDRVG